MNPKGMGGHKHSKTISKSLRRKDLYTDIQNWILLVYIKTILYGILSLINES